jgi:hypothetical protein
MMLLTRQQLQDFKETKANTFPYNELTLTRNNVYARWITFVTTTSSKSRGEFPVLSSCMSSEVVTFLIVTNQATPYTPAMSEVMDTMRIWGRHIIHAIWYDKVVATLQNILSMDWDDAPPSRRFIFMSSIQSLMKDKVEEKFGSAGLEVVSVVILNTWYEWFFSEGYTDGASFFEVAVGSLQYVNLMCTTYMSAFTM